MNKVESILSRRDAALPRGISQAHPIAISKAKNAEIWDADGKRYIDFIAGIAVLNTGHAHPKVIEAARAQLDDFTHTSFQVIAYDGYVRLCERINQLAPGSEPKKSMLVNSGSEAVENAVKIARAATGRSAIISFRWCFHGRTLLTVGMTGKTKPYKVGVGPFPNELYHAKYPCAQHGVSVEDALQDIEQIFTCDVLPERVAAIIIEPVIGEGGYYPAPPAFMKGLRALCDKHGILMIVDEVQTGVARSGRFFAIEHSDVVPDIITMAKGIGGGFPISAVVGKAAVMDKAIPGALGGTYGGHPVSCAAANAVLDIAEEEKLCARATEIGTQITKRLAAMKSQVPEIADIRNLGALAAVELCEGGDLEKPAVEFTKRVIKEAFARGLLLLTCGVNGNIIRFMTPLTIETNVLNEGLDILEAAFKAAK